MTIKVSSIYSKLALLSVFVYITSCVTPCPDCVDPTFLNEPAKIITVKQAKNMYDEYDIVEEAIKGVKANADGTEYNPTRYIEYTFEEMKHYMAYIENEAKLANVDISKLRIYYGAYPDAATFESGDPARYRKQESIFIMPTALSGSGKEAGFFTTGEPGSDARRPIFFTDLDNEDLKSRNGKNGNEGGGRTVHSEASFFSFTNTQGGDDRSLILNDGNVIPPPEQDTDMDGKGKEGDGNNRGNG